MIPHKESKQTEKLEEGLPVSPRIDPNQDTCHVPGMFEASEKQQRMTPSPDLTELTF